MCASGRYIKLPPVAEARPDDPAVRLRELSGQVAIVNSCIGSLLTDLTMMGGRVLRVDPLDERILQDRKRLLAMVYSARHLSDELLELIQRRDKILEERW